MLTFYEYLAQRRTALPDPVTMMLKAGIDLGGPSELQVQRVLKRWKKWRANPAKTSLGVADPAPQSLGK